MESTENNEIKCTSKNHEKIKAIYFCQICKIYICKNCEISHSNLCPNHNLYELNKDIKEIFTGFCQKEKHNEELEYFCKTHNEICCASCLCVIKGKGKGQHSSCDICFIEDIKEDKKNKLENNIKFLEDLSVKLDDSIINLKKCYEEIEKRKENLLKKFMKIFTQLREALNKREDEIMSEIETDFRDKFFKEDISKTTEKLPYKVKSSIENGEIIKNKWEEENKLNLMIYNCINIEKNINDIKLINDSIEKYKDSDKNLHIKYEEKNYENEINNLLQTIKFFAVEDKLNIYIRFKELEQEKAELKEKISHISNNIIKNTLSKFYESNNVFTIRSRCNENYCLDTPGNGVNYSPHLWEYINNNGNQIFLLIKNKDETYSIKNSVSGYFLGMEESDDEWIFISRIKGKNYQKFKIIYSGEQDYFLFLNEKGKVIDLINNRTKNGASIKPKDFSLSLGQQWKLFKI